MKLKVNDIEAGFLYQTSDLQYRAVLAMKDNFVLYVPSLIDNIVLNLSHQQPIMPFENQPYKKCQIATFAKKDYQLFSADDTQTHLAIKHRLNEWQLNEVIKQCNAQSAISAW